MTAPTAKMAAKKRSQVASRRSAGVSGTTSGSRDAGRAISTSSFDLDLQDSGLCGAGKSVHRVAQRIHRVDQRRNGDLPGAERRERRGEGAAARADDGHLVDDRRGKVETMLAGDR